MTGADGVAQGEYPRVLIIGQSFNTQTGGGITLTNHFRGWPRSRVAVVAPRREIRDFSICEKYYALGADEVRFFWKRAGAGGVSEASGPVTPPARGEGSAEALQEERDRGLARRILGGAARFVIHRMGVGQFIEIVTLSPRLMSWIDDFRPDVVYTQLASRRLVRLVNQAVEWLGIPLVVHIMDDWPSVIYRDSVLGGWMNRVVNEEFRELLGKTARLVGISELMARVYAERYGRPVVYSHNPVDLAVWHEYQKTDWSAGEQFRFVYAGRVGRANARSLADAASAVSDLARGGVPVHLDVYTQDALSDLAKSLHGEGVCVRRAVPYGEVRAVLAGADALVLPLDFDDEGFAFAQFSMPTKVVEYMASGSPVLVYAPRGGALAEYARGEDSWALLVDEQSREGLRAAMMSLVSDAVLRERLGRSAIRRAETCHDAVQVRERFRTLLSDAAASRQTGGQSEE